MPGHLRLFVKARKHGNRGPLFDGFMNKPAPDGWQIVTGSTEPLLAAARVLRSQGVTGSLEMWDGERAYCRLRGDIDQLAKLTVTDGASAPVSFRRWRQLEETADEIPATKVLEKIKAEITGLLSEPCTQAMEAA